ncbi:MAG: hypothetical protein IH988_03280 [Planctomycetes bacterium]|nr:hypothetical protein [Planctomycetota bacterium]
MQIAIGADQVGGRRLDEGQQFAGGLELRARDIAPLKLGIGAEYGQETAYLAAEGSGLSLLTIGDHQNRLDVDGLVAEDLTRG